MTLRCIIKNANQILWYLNSSLGIQAFTYLEKDVNLYVNIEHTCTLSILTISHIPVNISDTEVHCEGIIYNHTSQSVVMNISSPAALLLVQGKIIVVPVLCMCEYTIA